MNTPRSLEREEWAHLDSNQEPKRYERRALPLSYGPVTREQVNYTQSKKVDLKAF